jgi:hypothetical protein
LIRQASTWLPSQPPRPAALQDLEHSEAIRWVDLNGGGLSDSEALALLDPVCRGQLDAAAAGDLIGRERSLAHRDHEELSTGVRGAFRIRHLGTRNDGRGSQFEPVRLLAGEDWLISCWLEPRVYRGMAAPTETGGDPSDELYAAVGAAWLRTCGASASDLAALIQAELSGDAVGFAPGG